MATVLTSIQSLLTDPNPDSPANSEAANLYTEDRETYNKRVKDCVLDSVKELGSDAEGGDSDSDSGSDSDSDTELGAAGATGSA